MFGQEIRKKKKMRRIQPYDPVIQFSHRRTGSPRNSLPRLCNTKPEEEEEEGEEEEKREGKELKKNRRRGERGF